MDTLDLMHPAVARIWSADGPGEWWWLWKIAMFLIWVVIVFLLVRFMAGGRGWRRNAPSPMERARGILAERYARGEIDEEEYRKRSETLR